MRRLRMGFGIGLLTLTLSSASFARVGQTGPNPKHSTGLDSSVGPKSAAAKHNLRGHSPATPAVEETEQLPSEQARTRASLQEAAAHEPVPDERTLRREMEESKRLLEERKRAEQKTKEPHARDVSQGIENSGMAENAPQQSVASEQAASISTH